MTLTELQNYYASLLIIQYRRQPKAIGTIQMIANLSLCDGLMLVEPSCFDLDTALGEQLTILGRIVGVPRNIVGLDLAHIFWAFRRYADATGGVDFLRYADTPDPNNLFSRYQSNATYTLSDFEMQSLIKLKIIFNNTFESYKYVIEAFWNIFGNEIQVIDNKDMTVTYNVDNKYANVFIVAQFLNVVPRPMGVEAIINLV